MAIINVETQPTIASVTFKLTLQEAQMLRALAGNFTSVAQSENPKYTRIAYDLWADMRDEIPQDYEIAFVQPTKFQPAKR